MAKPAFYDSRIVFHNSKVQFGCNCCCVDPEINIVAPSNGYTNWGYGAYGTFSCRALVRFADTVRLLISTDGGSTYSTFGTSGVGLNAFIGGVSGQSPTYGPDWVDLQMRAVYTAAPNTLYLFDRPSTIYWKLQAENDCGATVTESDSRVYRWRNRDDPPPVVDCNEATCAGSELSNSYVIQLLNCESDYGWSDMDGSHLLTYDFDAVACRWRKDLTSPDRYIILAWLGSYWYVSISDNPPTGDSYSGPQFNNSMPCDPTVGWTAFQNQPGTPPNSQFRIY